MDSGIDVNQLRGSDRVGVYVGVWGADYLGITTSDPSHITGYEVAGVEPSMFPARYAFRDWQICSSSSCCPHKGTGWKNLHLGIAVQVVANVLGSVKSTSLVLWETRDNLSINLQLANFLIELFVSLETAFMKGCCFVNGCSPDGMTLIYNVHPFQTYLFSYETVRHDQLCHISGIQ